MLRVAILLAFAHILPAHAQVDTNFVNRELSVASRSVNEGHIKEGYDRSMALLRQIDPIKDKDNYWRTSTSLIELLNQIEDQAQVAQLLNTVISTKIPETQPVKQWMQFYIGRNLAYSGKAEDGEKFLRALTGGDARLVLIPAQRAAAIVFSRIEFDRGNIDQAAI
jgi:hypothetical protein